MSDKINALEMAEESIWQAMADNRLNDEEALYVYKKLIEYCEECIKMVKENMR